MRGHWWGVFCIALGSAPRLGLLQKGRSWRVGAKAGHGRVYVTGRACKFGSTDGGALQKGLCGGRWEVASCKSAWPIPRSMGRRVGSATPVKGSEHGCLGAQGSLGEVAFVVHLRRTTGRNDSPSGWRCVQGGRVGGRRLSDVWGCRGMLDECRYVARACRCGAAGGRGNLGPRRSERATCSPLAAGAAPTILRMGLR